MKITFDDENGVVVPDGKLLEFASDILEKGEDVTIESELLVDAIRFNMIMESIDPDSVTFCFKDKEITVDELYNLKEYPYGFCDHHLHILQGIRYARNCPDAIESYNLIKELI